MKLIKSTDPYHANLHGWGHETKKVVFESDDKTQIYDELMRIAENESDDYHFCEDANLVYEGDRYTADLGEIIDHCENELLKNDLNELFLKAVEKREVYKWGQDYLREDVWFYDIEEESKNEIGNLPEGGYFFDL